MNTLKRQLISLRRRCKSLQTIDDILRTRTVKMACRYCGRSMLVLIPFIWELENAIRKSLVYPTRCHHCGYTNQISPYDILASIAWTILAASYRPPYKNPLL